MEQSDWITPVCSDWISVLDAAIRHHGDRVVLAAHSLGCATVAHWAGRYRRKIRGALLVGPSDVEAPSYPSGTTGFTPMPLDRLPFPTIVVASRNDQFVTFERAQYFANCWGPELEDAGNAGHLNADCGYGPARGRAGKNCCVGLWATATNLAEFSFSRSCFRNWEVRGVPRPVPHNKGLRGMGRGSSRQTKDLIPSSRITKDLRVGRRPTAVNCQLSVVRNGKSKSRRG